MTKVDLDFLRPDPPPKYQLHGEELETKNASLRRRTVNYEMSALHQEIRYARALADREQAAQSNAAIHSGGSNCTLVWAISFHSESQYSTSTIFVNGNISFCNIHTMK